jgi:flagellar motor switch/type III secretory pathway protein FliN
MGQRFDQQWTSHRPENPATTLAIKRKLTRDLRVMVECDYAGDSICMKDLLSLAVGDVLVLPGFDETVDVLVNGLPRFRGGLTVSPTQRNAVAIGQRLHDARKPAMNANTSR